MPPAATVGRLHGLLSSTESFNNSGFMFLAALLHASRHASGEHGAAYDKYPCCMRFAMSLNVWLCERAGARPEVRARNREALYALSSAFERCAGKRARRSGATGISKPEALLDPAAPAEPPGGAGAPGAGDVEPGVGARAPSGKVSSSAGTRHAVAARPAPPEFTLRPLDSRLVHAKRLRPAAAEAPELASSAGGAEAAVLPPRSSRQERKAGGGAVGPLSGGAAAKAVLGSKRKAAGTEGSGSGAVVCGSTHETAAEQGGAPAVGRDAGDAAAAMPLETLDLGASAAPVVAILKLGKKKRRALAKAGGAAEAADAAAGTASTGGAGGATPSAQSGSGRGKPAAGGSATPALQALCSEGGAEAPAAVVETPAGTEGAGGSASGGAAAAAAAAAACKKRVKFALSRNLAHSFGAPAPPPAVRTPPGAQPKGSALKHAAGGPAGGSPVIIFRRSKKPMGSAPGRLGGGGSGVPGVGLGQSRLGLQPGATVRRLAARSPKSLPRAQAAQFF